MTEPSKSPQSDDLRIVIDRMSSGDEGALTTLYRATSKRVFGLAMQITRDHQLAEEVTLEVFEQAWRTAGTYGPARGTPQAWLLVVTRSRAIDSLRNRASKLDADHLAALATQLKCEASDPVESAENREQAALIRDATRQLPRGQREALAAAYFGGLSQVEIAKTLDVPLGTVKSRIRAGLSALREALGSYNREQK